MVEGMVEGTGPTVGKPWSIYGCVKKMFNTHRRFHYSRPPVPSRGAAAPRQLNRATRR